MRTIVSTHEKQERDGKMRIISFFNDGYKLYTMQYIPHIS